MFDVGFSELLLVLLVALVVFGPDRLPKLVRETTFWIRKIRGAFESARSEIDRELQLMEVKATMEERRRQFLEEAESLGLTNGMLEHRPVIEHDAPDGESAVSEGHAKNTP